VQRSDDAVAIQNLTGHPVTLDTGRDTRVTIEPGGRTARVAEPAQRDAQIRTLHGLVREVVLRRSRTINGLPRRQPGVVYLVPRLTAAAARNRADLVFLYDERRGAGGAVVGARALGRFAAPLAPPDVLAALRARWRRGWLWPAQREWVIGAGFAFATAVLGAALSGIPTAASGDWSDPHIRAQLWAYVTLAAVGVLALVGSTMAWRRRNLLMRRRGTAYILKEDSVHWTAEQSISFVSQLDRQFARTLWVPGPGRIDRVWQWPLDGGAQRWEAKLAELIHAFQAASYNDDQATVNALYVWAWWPVALAFAAQVTSVRRDLVLEVRQRPSFGRMGIFDRIDWSQPPHRFARSDAQSLSAALPGTEAREFTWHVTINSVSLTAAASAESTVQRHDDPGQNPRPAPVRVLVVRFSTQEWGPLPPPHIEPEAQRLALRIRDAADLGLPASLDTTVTELRCIPDGGGFPWHAFPALVRCAGAWIEKQAANTPDALLLLGTSLPQEVAVGLGIDAAQAGHGTWPRHMWPMVHRRREGEPASFVVPRLDVGRPGLIRKGL